MRIRWLIFYRLYVDGKSTPVMGFGYNKREAWEWIGQDWKEYYPDIPLPQRERCKLVEEERERDS